MEPKEIEDAFYDVGRRIASFDPIRDDVTLLKKSIKETNDRINSLQDSISKKIDSIFDRLEGIFDLQSNHSNILRSLTSEISNIEQCNKSITSKNSKIEEELKSQSNCLYQFFELLKEETKKTDRLDKDFKDISNKILESNKELNLYHEKIQSLRQDSISHASKIKQIDVLKDDINIFKNEITSNIKSIKESSSKSIEESNKLTNLRLTNITSMFEAKINNSESKIPSISHLAEKFSVEKISSQLESMSLDVKNSLLKSSNNESQNNLNVKKIENIQLILKQYELAKG